MNRFIFMKFYELQVSCYAFNGCFRFFFCNLDYHNRFYRIVLLMQYKCFWLQIHPDFRSLQCSLWL